MNRLFILNNMGFTVFWKVISMGLYGYDEIPSVITYHDVIEYLDGLLTDNNDQTDDIIALICEKDDVIKFDKLLKELTKKDFSDIVIQKRKWKACLLKEIIDNPEKDYMQGLLNLMEFWVSMGKPNNCPQSFPICGNEKSVQDYFTQDSYDAILNNNREWLNDEIINIIKLEN